jgi:hypothetical protein
MPLHTDVPSRADVDALWRARASSCVSLYLPTVPASTGDAERLELRSLAGAALDQLHAAGADGADVEAVEEQLADLADDDTFWRHQARSLAVFVSPRSLATFRLPNRLLPLAAVSDRFHLKPLLRAITFPQAAFALALAQNSVRLLEILPDLPPAPVDVPDLPADVASAVGKSSVAGRAPVGRIQGSEGRKVRMRQYARQVDQALRPVLPGHGVPLVLASTEPLESIFRSVCRYPDLAPVTVAGNPEALGDAELVAGVREVLDRLHADQLRDLQDLFEQRSSAGRTATDVADVARFATYGAVDTLVVDIDSTVPGHVDEETGAVTFEESDDAVTYGVVDEIARRAWLAGGRVLGVRQEDVPGGGAVAAILRYAP